MRDKHIILQSLVVPPRDGRRSWQAVLVHDPAGEFEFVVGQRPVGDERILVEWAEEYSRLEYALEEYRKLEERANADHRRTVRRHARKRHQGDNTIVGYVENTGQLICIPCGGAGNPVYVNSNPHAFECCDECGRVLNETILDTKGGSK